MNNEWNCQSVTTLLGPFFRNELPEEASEQVRAHVRRCGPCRERLSEHVAAELLEGRPEVFEPRESSKELFALAASVQSEQSNDSELSLEGIVDEWQQHFGNRSDPSTQSES